MGSLPIILCISTCTSLPYHLPLCLSLTTSAQHTNFAKGPALLPQHWFLCTWEAIAGSFIFVVHFVWTPWSRQVAAAASLCSAGPASTRGSSSIRLGTLEENLVLALPWSHPSECPMTGSSKGPNSSLTTCNSTSKFTSSCDHYRFFPSSDPNLSLIALSIFSSSWVFWSVTCPMLHTACSPTCFALSSRTERSFVPNPQRNILVLSLSISETVLSLALCTS